MKRLMQLTLMVAILMMAAGSAMSQDKQKKQRPGGGRGFGGGFGFGTTFLLTQESVQKDLKLSDDQIKKVKELAEKQRGDRPDFQGLSREEIQKKMAERRKAQDEAVAKILEAKQVKRLKQISLQQQGSFALSNPEVAKELKITDDQKEKIRDIQTKAREEMRDLRGEENAKKREEARKATGEKVMGVLTADQKAKLKEMQGAPFTGKIERPQFGGGRPGGGRPQRPAADKKG